MRPSTNSRLLFPLLVGYRHSFNGFFVEPQLRVWPLSVQAQFMGRFLYRNTELHLPGHLRCRMYMFNNKIEVSARYQAATSSRDDYWDIWFETGI